MTIQVESNLQGEIGSRETYRVTSEPAPEMEQGDPEVTEPLNGDITITHDPQGLAVRGQLTTAVKLDCDRCMSEYEYPLTASVDGLYQDKPDEDNWPIIDGSINLGPLIRESIVLAVPARKLCKPDCTVPLEY